MKPFFVCIRPNELDILKKVKDVTNDRGRAVNVGVMTNIKETSPGFRAKLAESEFVAVCKVKPIRKSPKS